MSYQLQVPNLQSNTLFLGQSWNIKPAANGLTFSYNGIPQAVIPEPLATSTISFYLNGKLVTVNNPDPTLTLLDYLRYQVGLIATKKMCNQGGCGICAVMLSYLDADSNLIRNVSINSCLRLLVNCDGCAITTNEGIIPNANGKLVRSNLRYHPVQERIAKTYGLQCGGCTAGVVMTTYAALQPNSFITINDGTVEKLYDGNICRCSCYNGITKLARSFVPTSQIKDSSNNVIGYNLSATGSTVTSQNLIQFKIDATTAINNTLAQSINLIQTTPGLVNVAAVSATWTAAVNAFIPTINAEVSNLDIYNGFRGANSLLIGQFGLGLINMGVAATGPMLLALQGATEATGPLGPLGSANKQANNAIFSIIADNKPNADALAVISAAAANTPALIAASIANMVAAGVFGAGSTGANLLASLLGLSAQAFATSATSWVNNSPQKPGQSLYRANGTINDQTAFTNYNPANDVNGNNYAAFLQSYVKGPAVFIAPAPYNFAYHRVQSIQSLVEIMRANGIANTELISAGTSYGVPGYGRKPNITAYIDINGITELNAVVENSSSLTIGANVSLNKMWYLLANNADQKFKRMGIHISYIAGQHVRNAGAWVGGFTMTKNSGFAGDTATVLGASRATLNVTYVFPTYTTTAQISVRDYLTQDLSDRFIIIRSVVIPKAVSGEFFDSYRVALRYFNAHPLLNNAFSVVLDGSNTITSAVVCYGACTNSTVQYATAAEQYLVGKQVTFANLNSIMSGVLPLLASGIVITPDPNFVCPQYPDGRTAYRNSLVQSMFYLSFCKLLKSLGFFSTYPSLAPIESGIEYWITETRTSNTTYDWIYDQVPDQRYYPLHFPMPKWDASLIAGSFAKYTDDIATPVDALFVGIAHTTVSNGQVDWTHPQTISALAQARAIAGVKAVITINEMTGYIANNVIWNTFGAGTEFFANTAIAWNGQPLAIICATTQQVAYKVARELVVQYKNVGLTPVYLTIQDALNAGAVQPVSILKQGYDALGYLETPLAPYKDGDAGLELAPGYINYNPVNSQNLIPQSGVFATGPFVGLPKWTDSTGIDHLWSPLIINSTGYSSDNHHFPMEKHTMYCYRDDNGQYQIYQASQYPKSSLNSAYTWLGLTENDVVSNVKRMGGTFGHKLVMQAAIFARIALLSCIYTQRPIKLVADLQTDMKLSGARSDILWQYKLGFQPNGTINSANVVFNFADRVSYRGDFMAGLLAGEILAGLNAYIGKTPNRTLDFNVADIRRPGRCPLRAFGNPQAAFAQAIVYDEVAAWTNLSFSNIVTTNLIDSGTTTGPISANLTYQSLLNMVTTDPRYDFTNRKAAVNAFNAVNKYKKRGIEFMTHQYIINKSFNFDSKDICIRIKNNGFVMVWICSTESGQGILQKGLQALSMALKCPMSALIMQDYSNTMLSGDCANGGSQGSEVTMWLAAKVAEKALAVLGTRIGQNAAGHDIVVDGSGNPILDAFGQQYDLTQGVYDNNPTAWNKLVSLFSSAVSPGPVGQAGIVMVPSISSPNTAQPPLHSSQIGASTVTPNQNVGTALKAGNNELIFRAINADYITDPQAVYFMSINEVEVDVLTGNMQILRTDVLYDIGESANRGLDAGQLEGGFIFGLGYFFQEERLYGYNGELLTTDTWEYKPPCPVNLPQKIFIEFTPNTYAYAQRADRNASPWAFGAKATQEMSTLPCASAYAAVKAAIRAYRVANGLSASFSLPIPATADKIKQACGNIALNF